MQTTRMDPSLTKQVCQPIPSNTKECVVSAENMGIKAETVHICTLGDDHVLWTKKLYFEQRHQHTLDKGRVLWVQTTYLGRKSRMLVDDRFLRQRTCTVRLG